MFICTHNNAWKDATIMASLYFNQLSAKVGILTDYAACFSLKYRPSKVHSGRNVGSVYPPYDTDHLIDGMWLA